MGPTPLEGKVGVLRPVDHRHLLRQLGRVERLEVNTRSVAHGEQAEVVAEEHDRARLRV